VRVDRPALLREAVDALALAADFDVNHRSATYGGRGLLAVAARIGAVRVAERLLALGAAPDVADDEGWTPLMEAAFRGNERVAAALLARGARDEGFEARRYMGAAEKNARDAGGGGRGGGEGEEAGGEKDGEGVFGGGGERREALVAGPFRASEWAAYRGNARLAAAIRSGGFGEGDKLTRTNVTPFSI
jgi:ankyrin repeat protein